MIHCAAISAIISVGALVLPLVMLGMAPRPPRAGQRPPAAVTRRRMLSSTASGSSTPMRVVPTGWKMVVAMSPARRASSVALVLRAGLVFLGR